MNQSPNRSQDQTVITFSAAATWLLGFAAFTGAGWYEFRCGPSAGVVWTEAWAMALVAPSTLVFLFNWWTKR